MAFIDVADVSRDGDTVRRDHHHAQAAHDAIVDLLGKVALDAAKRER
jgi:hypothetical protein